MLVRHFMGREDSVDGNSADLKSDVSRALTTASDAHADPRVGVPMIVELEHFRSTASAWSVSGFSLETAVPGLSMGDVRSARVVLRISDVDLGFDIPCQVTRESEIGAAEFKFLGAFTEPAALLHRIAEDHLAGYATQFDSLICSQLLHDRVVREENSFSVGWYPYWQSASSCLLP
jgi:hypothetical protein